MSNLSIAKALQELSKMTLDILSEEVVFRAADPGVMPAIESAAKFVRDELGHDTWIALGIVEDCDMDPQPLLMHFTRLDDTLTAAEAIAVTDKWQARDDYPTCPVWLWPEFSARGMGKSETAWRRFNASGEGKANL